MGYKDNLEFMSFFGWAWIFGWKKSYKLDIRNPVSTFII